MLSLRIASVSLLLTGLTAAMCYGEVVPRPAEDLQFKTMDNKDHRISEYKGKTLAVILMSPTCPHCQHLTEGFHPIAERLASKGVVILEIAFDEMTSYIPEFVQKFHPPAIVGHANRDNINSFMQHSVMSPFMVPQMVLIDRNGVIRKQYPAGDNTLQLVQQGNTATMVNDIDQVIAEGGASKHTATSSHRAAGNKSISNKAAGTKTASNRKEVSE